MVAKQPKRKERPGVDSYGRTPLHLAAAKGKVSEVERLLELGANPNAQDDNGWSPLHFSAQAVSPEVARVLLLSGADLELKDSFGNTPLFRAVFESKGNGSVIEVFLKAGARIDTRNSAGVTPLSLAKTIANYDVAKFFKNAS